MPEKFAIIGGGLSGSLCAIELMRQSEKPIQITLFEKESSQLHKGVAYSSQLPYQLLNVPIAQMSLFADEPNHFLEWYTDKIGSVTPEKFVERKVFGTYVRESIELCKKRFPKHQVNVIFEEVVSLLRGKSGYSLSTHNGSSFEFDCVFVCTGNLPPTDLSEMDDSVKVCPRYVSQPWSGFNISKIKENDEICIIGSGLTMVDQVISLTENGHKGHITAISRNGRMPLPHGEALTYEFSESPKQHATNVRQLLAWFRNELHHAEQIGIGWISVINALRPFTAEIWFNLPTGEKEKFMRQLRPFWETHRHRIPQESAAKLKHLMEKGQFKIVAGRIQNVSTDADRLKVTFREKLTRKNQTEYTDWIINCSGPQANFRKIDSPLFVQLFKSGIATPDPLGLGLHVTQTGRLLNPQSYVYERIFVIGPPSKGTHWESTALREIRSQATKSVTESIKH